MRARQPYLSSLLLAAGGSQRLGQPKQLLQLQDESLVHHIAGLLLANADEVIVVTGACVQELETELQDLPVRMQHNAAWRSGMGGSIASGMRAVNKRADGVMIMLCDQWKIESADLQTLVTAWGKEPECITTAAWGENSGPPVIFPGHLFDELRQLRGPRGAKHLLGQQSKIRRVEIPNAQFDLDTDADLQIMRSVGSESSARVKG